MQLVYRLLFPTFLWFIFAQPAAAAQALPVSVERLARGSEVVIQARVEKHESRWSESGRHIYTLVTLRTESVWRGSAPERVVVRVRGGEVGDIGERVDAMATFSEGEQVVVFLVRGRDDYWRVHGMGLGKFHIDAGQAQPSMHGISFTKRAVSAGERLIGPMALEELERRVRGAQ